MGVKKKVAILISGGGSNMAALIADMQTADHPAEPVLVVSNQEDAAGLSKAHGAGVPTARVLQGNFPIRADFEAALLNALDVARPDIICLAGFMRVLSPAFVERWAGKMLNIHPSLLPRYPGLNTHQQCIDAGDRDHGCTVHGVTAVLDAGPLLGQATIRVFKTDTARSLAQRLLPVEHRLYCAVLRRFAADESEPVYLP